MTEQELEAIKERCRMAEPESSNHSLHAAMESMKDVPALIAEVERLRAVGAGIVRRFCLEEER
ncbi:MAG TPA: hypothetical protein VGP44_11710 [Gemmatimonadales bacterium]|nr:hypothetical protein [Gemmatimonadales bacterium]